MKNLPKQATWELLVNCILFPYVLAILACLLVVGIFTIISMPD